MTDEQVMVTQTAEQVGKAIAAAEKGACLAGRRYQHQQDVDWLEKHTIKERMLSHAVVIMGIEVWQAFVNLKIEGE